MSRQTFQEWHVEIDMSRVICQEWHVESDMASGSRPATVRYPSMPLLFNVLTLLGVSSWTFMLSVGPFKYWSRLVTGNPSISVSACLRVIHWDLGYQKILRLYCMSHDFSFGVLFDWRSGICVIVTTPTQPQLNSKVAFDTKITLDHHPPPTTTTQTQCHQYLSCCWPDFDHFLKEGLWDQQQ